MNDGPSKRKEHHFLAFELQRMVLANAISIDILELREQNPGSQLDYLIGPRVNNAKLEAAHTIIRSDHRSLAEHNLRRRTRESREQEPGSRREAKQSTECFQADDPVSQPPN